MEDKKHICKYCGKEFSSFQKLGGHITKCKLNPSIDLEKQKEKIKRKCKETYDIKERTIVCPICGKEHVEVISKHLFEIGKYKKTCSDECAKKLSSLNTNKEIKTIKQKENYLKKKENGEVVSFNKGKRLVNGHYIYDPNYFKPFNEKCKYCGKVINSPIRKYCSKECRKADMHNFLSLLAKKNNFGGYHPNSIKNHKKGTYLGLHFDSSWELAFIVYCKEHNMNISRFKGYRTYQINGEIKKYYPDFTVDNKHYEIKGYYDEFAKQKHLQNPDIILLKRNEMKKYVEYTKNKYGENFTETLLNN